MKTTFEPRPLKRYEPPQRNGNLYYVRLKTPAGILYKIGFTTMNSVQERLAYNGNGDEKLIEKVIFFVYLEDAFDVECQLHELFADKVAFSQHHSHEVAPLHKNGQTELYRSDVLGMDTEYTSDEAYYRRQGLSEGEVQQALKRQARAVQVLHAVLWAPIKLLEGVLWLYERFSKTDFYDKARARKELLNELIEKINNAKQFSSASDTQQASDQQNDDQRGAIGFSGLQLSPASQERASQRQRLVTALKSARFGAAPAYIGRWHELDEELITRFADTWDWESLSDSLFIRYSPELIKRFEERWDWRALSRNVDLPWSDTFIHAFSSRWNWNALSSNRALPWTTDLIAQHSDKWDWFDLSGNTKIPFDEAMMERFAEMWDWYEMSGNPALPLTPELIVRFSDQWEWGQLTRNSALTMSSALIERFKDHWDWRELACRKDIEWSLELLEQYVDRIYWPWLSSQENLPWSQALIERFEDRWDWQRLAANEALPWSTELINAFENKWVIETTVAGLDGFACNTALPWSPELIERFEHRLNWFALSKNTALPWSLDLIVRYQDRWSWPHLSRNTALPWSLELIERYRDRWDWGTHEPGLSYNTGVPWTTSLIYQLREDLDTCWLAANTAVPWSVELIDELKDELDWCFLSRNPALPWSISLIERFADRWHWDDHGFQGARAKLPALFTSQVREIMQFCEDRKRANAAELNALIHAIKQ